MKACALCRPHPYQDKKYGQGMRVHNVGAAKQSSGNKLTCTVCGKKHEGKV